MNLTISQLLLLFSLGLLLSAVFSMVEAAVISQDRHRLEHSAHAGKKTAVLMLQLLGGIDKLLAAILLFNNIANVLCATTAAVIVARVIGGGDTVTLLSSFAVAFIILVISEISPKVIGVRHAQNIALFCAVPLRILLNVFYPVIVVANFFARGILLLCGVRDINILHTAMSPRELRNAARTARRQRHETEHKQYQMAEQALHIGDLPVEKIMTPRPAIEGINLQDGDDKTRSLILSSRHSKLPAYNGNLDRACGFIDTLRAAQQAADQGAETVKASQLPFEAPMFLPAAAGALHQLQSMRKNKARAALVVDGAGRVVGMVTAADFADTIIGRDTPLSTDENGNFMLTGDLSLLRLEELFPHLSLPEDTSATNVNGLILETLGDFPDGLFCVNINGFRFEISEVTEASIRRVLLKNTDD